MSNRKSAKFDPIDPKPNSNSSWVLLDCWAGLGLLASCEICGLPEFQSINPLC